MWHIISSLIILFLKDVDGAVGFGPFLKILSIFQPLCVCSIHFFICKGCGYVNFLHCLTGLLIKSWVNCKGKLTIQRTCRLTQICLRLRLSFLNGIGMPAIVDQRSKTGSGHWLAFETTLHHHVCCGHCSHFHVQRAPSKIQRSDIRAYF